MTSAPMRKLHELLSINPAAQKDSAKLQTFGNRSFQNVPIDPCQVQNNPANLAPGNLPFRNFPKSQNLYYNPLIRTNDNSYPSPMIHFNGVQNQRVPHQMYLNEPSQTELENQANIYGSSINSQLLNSLTALEGSKMSMLNQPKNLGELLQRSYLSTHSTTGLQSPSPYMGYNQNSIGPDYSNLLPASVLGTPLQPPQVIRNQNVPHQPVDNSNEGLLQQLGSLLKQSNGRDIKMALTGLIQQYNNGKNRTVDLLTRMQEEVPQRQGNQRTIWLSNGYVMNTVNRSTAESNSSIRNILDSARVMNNMMGREGPVFNDVSSKKKHYSIIPEEDSSMLGDVSVNQGRHSPPQTLNQKLNALNINKDTFVETQKEHVEYMSHLPIDEELSAILNERINPDLEPPGTLNREERTGKILKYKNKIRKYRNEHPVNRNFKGRSVVAGKKPRIKGKFVTIEEYVEYIKTTNTNEAGLPLNTEHFNESTAYDGSEKSTREHDLNIKEENL